jgi:putative FmdB family regulatory protein
MPLYDYGCPECGNEVEVFHKISESVRQMCVNCRVPMQKLLTTGMVKRPDASWVKDINGTINDLEEAQKGRQEYIETREQARKHINHAYRDPHPKVQELRKRYLERF